MSNRLRYTLLLLSAFCFPLCSHAAGWSTNWPSQANPRAGYIQLSEVWTSTVERCQGAGITNPSSPTWYRLNRSVLISCKSRLAAAIPSYINVTAFSDDTPVAQDWFATNAGRNAAFPMWSVTGLLVTLKMPTNYFAYTPWRSLSGLGGATNDSSVAYPHGETNASTVAGGTNFPVGRTAWYTTDYGWASWPSVCSGLVWTTVSTSGTPPYWVATNRYGNYIHYPEAYDSTEAGMQAKVDADYIPRSGGTYGDNGVHAGRLDATPPAAGSYYGSKTMCEFVSYVSGLSTQYAHTVEWYAWSTNIVGAYAGTWTFEDWGTGLRMNLFSFVGSSSASSNATVEYVWGVTNRPDWIAAPGTDYAVNTKGFDDVTYGVSPTSRRIIIRWDVSGGFTYR